ncbi:MAG: Mth938-like domain-containing protein [Gammaproteobacteria bacterium]
MKFALDSAGSHYTIKRYSPEGITINDTDYTRSLIVSADTLLTDWSPQTLEDLKPESFAPILELKPTILLLGVGERHQFPAPALLQNLYRNNIGVEIMTTAAACRTFNVLVAEGRSVVAALLRG